MKYLRKEIVEKMSPALKLEYYIRQAFIHVGITDYDQWISQRGDDEVTDAIIAYSIYAQAGLYDKSN